MNEELERWLESEYDYKPPERGDIVWGEVVVLRDEYALVDVGLKVEGVVPREDLARLDPEERARLHVGARVPVYVMRTLEEDGELVFSLYRARTEPDWERAMALMESQEVWVGRVKGFNRGGVLVPFGSLQGFVPLSHLSMIPSGLGLEEREEAMRALMGQSLPLVVVEINRRRQRLVFSERLAQRRLREERKLCLMETLKEGDIVWGTVRSLTSFGVFVDLGGSDGLIHVSELAWYRVRHPSEVLRVGERIRVYVLSIDREQRRINLSLKQLLPNPWLDVESQYAVGDVVEAEVMRLVPFGAFVRLETGVEGLVHRSEMPPEGLRPGERHWLRITHIDAQKQHISLSWRQVSPEEREAAMAAGAERKAAQGKEQSE